MIVRVRIYIVCVCWGLASMVLAQDAVFSQYYVTPLQLNPALAGNTVGARFGLNYRNQWPSLGQAYVTYAFSYDQFFEHLNSGIGVLLEADDAGQGLYKTIRAGATYAYRLQVNKSFFLKLGLEASAVRVQVDWDKLVFLDQIDPINGPVGQPTGEIRPEDLSKQYVDIGAGIVAYGRYFYGGLSLKHLNTPDESLLGVNDNLSAGLPMRFSLHAGAELPLLKDNKGKQRAFISPNIALIQQGGFGQLNGGAYVGMGNVFGGAWYRQTWNNGDAIIVMAGVSWGLMKFAYSYDVTTSGLAGQSGGSHEASLIIQLKASEQVDYNDCFELFR